MSKRKILKIWFHFDVAIIISKIGFIMLNIILQNTILIVSNPHTEKTTKNQTVKHKIDRVYSSAKLIRGKLIVEAFQQQICQSTFLDEQ